MHVASMKSAFRLPIELACNLNIVVKGKHISAKKGAFQFEVKAGHSFFSDSHTCILILEKNI